MEEVIFTPWLLYPLKCRLKREGRCGNLRKNVTFPYLPGFETLIIQPVA
jgi:hypothetical protein